MIRWNVHYKIATFVLGMCCTYRALSHAWLRIGRLIICTETQIELAFLLPYFCSLSDSMDNIRFRERLFRDVDVVVLVQKKYPNRRLHAFSGLPLCNTCLAFLYKFYSTTIVRLFVLAFHHNMPLQCSLCPPQ